MSTAIGIVLIIVAFIVCCLTAPIAIFQRSLTTAVLLSIIGLFGSTAIAMLGVKLLGGY